MWWGNPVVAMLSKTLFIAEIVMIHTEPSLIFQQPRHCYDKQLL